MMATTPRDHHPVGGGEGGARSELSWMRSQVELRQGKQQQRRRWKKPSAAAMESGEGSSGGPGCEPLSIGVGVGVGVGVD
jgi:hypothetical protein